MTEMENFINSLHYILCRGVFLLLIWLFCTSGLVAQQQPLQLNANTMESACAGEGHVISLKATGGERPYTYLWQDGEKGSFRKDLPSGTYFCTVRDAKGQAVTKQFSFSAQAAPLELSHSQEKVPNGSSRVSLQVQGGKAPYTYFWIGPGIDVKAAKKGKSLEGLQKGTYQIVVQDANECTANLTVSIK